MPAAERKLRGARMAPSEVPPQQRCRMTYEVSTGAQPGFLEVATSAHLAAATGVRLSRSTSRPPWPLQASTTRAVAPPLTTPVTIQRLPEVTIGLATQRSLPTCRVLSGKGRASPFGLPLTGAGPSRLSSTADRFRLASTLVAARASMRVPPAIPGRWATTSRSEPRSTTSTSSWQSVSLDGSLDGSLDCFVSRPAVSGGP